MAMTPPRESQEKPDTAEDAAKQKVEQPDPDAVTLTIEQLRTTHAAALGTVRHNKQDITVTPAVVAGAYHDVDGDTEVSIKDAKTRVREWLKSDQKQENS